jgi:uncharacterized membrane protein YdjX (TVP38/TMEM64 family)
MDTAPLIAFIYAHEEYAALLLILAKIIGAILFIPGTPLTLLAGALLGPVQGTIVSLIGNILGAFSAFLISRFLLRNYVNEKLLKKYPKMEKYEKRFFDHGFKTVVILRLIPLFPFNALNYLLGVTRVSVKDYFFGTAIGIIPGTIAFVYFGDSLRMLSFVHIILAITIILMLILLGKFYEKH